MEGWRLWFAVIVHCIGAASILLTVYALCRGPEFSGLSLSSREALKQEGGWRARLCLLTPFGMCITFAFAGWTMAYAFLWWAADIGLVQDGEWASWRDTVSPWFGLAGLVLALKIMSLFAEIAAFRAPERPSEGSHAAMSRRVRYFVTKSQKPEKADLIDPIDLPELISASRQLQDLHTREKDRP